MPQAPAAVPVLRVSRPALRLLDALGHVRRQVSFSEAAAIARQPRSSVARHLGELVEESLLLRLSRDLYATPEKPTRALLLVEPSDYARSVLLHADVLEGMGVRWALACLPVREAFPFELSRTVPVMRIDPHDGPEASLLREAVQLKGRMGRLRRQLIRFPTDAASSPHAVPRSLPVLDTTLSLAIFAATADPRMVHASLAAARSLGIPTERVLDQAAAFALEEQLPRNPLPNTLVLPKWLAEAARSAKDLHARRYLDRQARAEG